MIDYQCNESYCVHMNCKRVFIDRQHTSKFKSRPSKKPENSSGARIKLNKLRSKSQSSRVCLRLLTVSHLADFLFNSDRSDLHKNRKKLPQR